MAPVDRTITAPEPTDAARDQVDAADSNSADLQASARVGRYVLIEQLGAGGAGIVWKAYDPQLDRAIALKLLRGRTRTEHERARFLREAKTIARLRHPNVVTVYDVGEHNNEPYLAMELVRGGSLRTWLHLRQRSVAEITDVFRQAAMGLAAAHAQGLIHRDFKPANVLVDDDGSVKVADFGLARTSGRDESSTDQAKNEDKDTGDRAAHNSPLLDGMTATGAVLGTPAYMAPEQLAGAPLQASADQYAFCVSLYEALTGARPTQNRDATAIDFSGTRTPARLQRLVRRGLEKNPNARFPSMEDLIRAITPPSKQRRAAVFLSIALVSGGAAFYWGNQLAIESECKAEGQQIRSVWNPERASTVGESFRTLGADYLLDAWQRAKPEVDSFAARWSDLRNQVCVDAELHNARTQPSLERSRACFDEQKKLLDALASQWASRDKNVVVNASSAAWALPFPERCADEVVLSQQFARDPSSAPAKASEGRRQFIEAQALRTMGQYDQAMALAQRVAQSAAAKGRLAVEVQRLTGLLHADLGRFKESRKTLERAFRAAEVAGLDREAFGIAAELVFTVGYDLHDMAAAERWIDIAQMKRERLSLRASDPDVANLFDNMATIYSSQDRFDESLRYNEQSLSLRKKHFGDKHPSIAITLGNIASMYARQGKWEPATEYLERAIEITEATVGPQHPDVAFQLNTLGGVQAGLGNHNAAIATFQRALAIRENALGKDHPFIALTLNNLGELYVAEGRLDDATRALERALAIREATIGRDHPDVGRTLASLGRLYLAAKRGNDSRAALERALAIERATSAAGEVTATTLFALAKAHWLNGDNKTAIEVGRDGLRKFEALGTPWGDEAAENLRGWLKEHR